MVVAPDVSHLLSEAPPQLEYAPGANAPVIPRAANGQAGGDVVMTEATRKRGKAGALEAGAAVAVKEEGP